VPRTVTLFIGEVPDDVTAEEVAYIVAGALALASKSLPVIDVTHLPPRERVGG